MKREETKGSRSVGIGVKIKRMFHMGETKESSKDSTYASSMMSCAAMRSSLDLVWSVGDKKI